MKIVYLYRKPMEDNFSIEKVFDIVRQNLSSSVQNEVLVPKFISKGFFRRIYNLVQARFHQGDINHVTGDIHYLALLLNKRKTILTIHDCGFLHRNHSKFETFVLKNFWYRWPIARSSIVTTVSQKTKNDILSFVGCAEDKIAVIGNPISSTFTKKPKRFDKTNPILLQIGTASNKNLENLIPSIAGIRCELWIVGHLKKEQEKMLSKFKIKYKNFINLEESEIVNRYEKADIVTFISKAEGFGVPIIEANAVGRPVITSRISPMLETASGAALFVDPENRQEIRDAIDKLINDEHLRSELVRKGYKNVERFAPKKIAGQYEKLYKELISR